MIKLHRPVITLFVVVILTATVMQSSTLGAEKEIVQFRLPKWKTTHFSNGQTARQVHDALRKIGCQVKQEQHGGHIDLTYRCPEWRSIVLTTHEIAHQWEHWLKSLDFETSHQH